MKIAAIDSNSILNRAFYGIRLLSSKDNTYTNAVYGFMNIFLKVLAEAEPDTVVFAFDRPEPTFRHELYSEYKAGRKPMPEELAMQFPIIKKLLADLGYKIIEIPGFEADDILGSIAKLCGENGGECVIVTGDRDCLQLVSDSVNVRLASTKAGSSLVTLYNTEIIKEKYGVSPKQLIEVKALMGDSSDNIPGVAGVGEKTALALIQKFDNIKYIYEHIDEIDIKDSVRAKLKNGKDSAELSRVLGEISTAAPVPGSLEDYRKGAGKPAEAAALLNKLEMHKLIERLRLDAVTAASGGETVESRPAQAHNFVYKQDFEKFVQKAGRIYISVELEEDFPVRLAVSDGAEIAWADSFCLEFMTIVNYIFSCDKKKIGHDIKNIYRYAFKNNAQVSGFIFDTSLAGYILNPLARSYEPQRLAGEYSVAVPPSLDSECLKNAALLPLLYAKMYSQIEENGQIPLLRDIELPLSEVLASMETLGFKVDAGGVRQFGETLGENIQKLEAQIYEYAGKSFNINSTQQLGKILFDELGLKSKKKTKTGYSTDADVLDALKYDHPIINDILEYRKLTKLKSTYVDGLLKEVKPDGRVHTRFNQTETRTGRISSTEPNMQNIPVRTELGREMRRFFLASEGKVLVDADYSQIELRVLAHIAGDENMAEAFRNGQDIHRSTAAKVFGLPPELVTSKMRSDSKAVNFGIVYGISAFSLSQDIGVSVSDARKYIEDYLNNFSGVRDYMKNTVEFGKENGYVKTMFNRRRNLPELSSGNFNQKSFGERVAMNMPIQGTAADIIKIAMIRVFRRLGREGLKSRLILQVHDELIIESPLEEAELATKILKEEMENAVWLSVPLTADINAGQNWYDAKW
ncbi:MAG: DNA polymerase I [Oscillospiraceae bacterium]|jgi:DNA polymerase-1|nr:DNA polymerase I [Oscillospiraceae bacterium]